MISCIIVDDEPKAIELLETYVERTPSLICEATFRNPVEALTYLGKHKVDLVLLDINMPLLSGISFLKTMQQNTEVILTTAYSEYAVESYEYKVLDYLLKPITFDRFFKAVSKVSERDIPEDKPNHIYIKDGYKNVKLALDDILYLEKQSNYIVYYTADKKVMSRQTVAEALSIVGDSFGQTHKSYVVNYNQVESFDHTSIHVKGHSIPVGRSYKMEVEKRFKA